MAPVGPIAPVGHTVAALPMMPSPAAQTAATAGFGDVLAAGLRSVDTQVARADMLVESYAKGDAVPVHQVTLALEQARLSIELAVQVRTRLVETYREFMGMQL